MPQAVLELSMEPRLAPNVPRFPFLYLLSIFSRTAVAPLPLGRPLVCICVSWGCCAVNTDRLLMAFECLIFLKLRKAAEEKVTQRTGYLASL